MALLGTRATCSAPDLLLLALQRWEAAGDVSSHWVPGASPPGLLQTSGERSVAESSVLLSAVSRVSLPFRKIKGKMKRLIQSFFWL